VIGQCSYFGLCCVHVDLVVWRYWSRMLTKTFVDVDLPSFETNLVLLSRSISFFFCPRELIPNSLAELRTGNYLD
jgi:hypothetical protein